MSKTVFAGETAGDILDYITNNFAPTASAQDVFAALDPQWRGKANGTAGDVVCDMIETHTADDDARQTIQDLENDAQG